MTGGFLRFLRRNTIALLALFLALGGTTYAASTSLIGKNTVASPQVVNGSLQTKDLSAKARAALKGNRGLRGLQGIQGPRGATGAQGVQGVQGVQGPAGPFPSGDVPSGVTIRGNYAAGSDVSAGEFNWDNISFGFQLSAAPTPHFIGTGTTPPAQCPGTALNPQAQAGHLCIYEGSQANHNAPIIFNPANGAGNSTNRWGAGIAITATAAGRSFSYGTWAVTSP